MWEAPRARGGCRGSFAGLPVQGKLPTGPVYLSPDALMLARLLITLVVLASTSFGRARAEQPSDDFDDDFGTLPAPPEAAPDEPSQAHGELDETTGAPAEIGYPPLDDDTPQTTSPSVRGIARTFVHPTVDGLVGGVHAVDANSAWPGTFRVGLTSNFFKHDGFIAKSDQHRRAGAALTLNVTPVEHLELAATFETYTTANRTTQPEVIQVIGDAHLFAKGYTRVLPWLTVGGDLELALLNGVGDIGLRGAATGAGLRGNATLDLRALQKPLPVIVRTNLRYEFDNSARLIRDVERERYAALATPASRRDEYRHLAGAAERYALRINRLDSIGATIGLEVPYRPRERVYVHPLLEWSVALPVNRQDYSCVLTRIPGQDSCLAQEGFSARPSVLTLGVRAQPYLPGLALLFAVDIATSGHRTGVRELALIEKYLLHFGISYAYDPRPRPAAGPRVVRVEVPAREIRAHIVGQVIDSETTEPVPGAIVQFEGTSLSSLITDEEGRFRSAGLPAGPQGMRIRAESYREALCVAVVTKTGGDIEARCELAPSVRYGAIAGRVVDTSGTPLSGARLLLHGPAELALTAGADGTFASDKVPVGEYDLEVQAENYFPRHTRQTITKGQRSDLGLTLHARSRTPLARLTPKRIVLKKALRLTEDGAALERQSEPLVAEIAELLRVHPELTQIEIQGHVAPLGDAASAQALSEQHANTVRSALIAAGVAPARLQAVGLGSTRPLVPNITAANRARNRRIELVIK